MNWRRIFNSLLIQPANAIVQQGRAKLPARRPAVTLMLQHQIQGNDHDFVATYGYDGDVRVKEVFCLAFKSGTDMQSLLHHACIAMSVGLQYGATMADYAKAFGESDSIDPATSIISKIARTGAALDAEAA